MYDQRVELVEVVVSIANQFITHFVDIYLEATPYLLLGFIVAGLLHQFVPSQVINRFVSGNPLIACLKAAIVGTPVPLCSCGVVPVGLGLHRDGVGKHASVSFLVATPENGVDSISLSYSLFGGMFTVVRIIVAIAVAVFTGMMVYLFDVRMAAPGRGEVQSEEGECCVGDDHVPSADRSNGLDFILHDFFPKISNWILFGFALSAVIMIFIPEGYMSSVDPRVSLLLAAAIGLPLYVCASASTPIALSFLYAGMSPGACLVFLITGPATNAANIPLYVKELGAKATYLFYGSLFFFSIICGWLVDSFISREDLNLSSFEHAHTSEGSMLATAGVVLFSLMLVYVYVKKARKLLT